MTDTRIAPRGTVRGDIKHFLASRAHLLRGEVLEVGSRIHEGAWWMNNRDLRPDLEWCGVDMQPGPGVDYVCKSDLSDLADLPGEPFGGVICSEVLEHATDPLEMLQACWLVMKPGALILVTTLTSFHIHGFPDDYWRFTPAGLRLLMERAGFEVTHCENHGSVKVTLNDHGANDVIKEFPIHVFAVGRKQA